MPSPKKYIPSIHRLGERNIGRCRPMRGKSGGRVPEPVAAPTLLQRLDVALATPVGQAGDAFVEVRRFMGAIYGCDSVGVDSGEPGGDVAQREEAAGVLLRVGCD